MSNFAPVMCTILIIEDDQRLASLLQTGIEEAGHHVLLAYDAEMALRLLAPLQLPRGGENKISLSKAHFVRKLSPRVSILLMVVVGYILATLTIRPIERALTSQKMFASNVSHELRTPLAAIMGELVLHNATIDVQTKEGHGTKFIISFTNNN